jgi:hypothetical protein
VIAAALFIRTSPPTKVDIVSSYQLGFSPFPLLLYRSPLFQQPQSIIAMGCSASQPTIDRWQIDDSNLVAERRDKRKNNTPKEYIPRARHPLLIPKQSINSMVDDSTLKTTSCDSDNNVEPERVLYHTVNHCDSTIDLRDSCEAKPTKCVK